MKKIKLSKNEFIIAAIPEIHSGPGWLNRTITLIIGENCCPGKYRTEYLQADECSREVLAIFDVVRVGQNTLKKLLTAEFSEK